MVKGQLGAVSLTDHAFIKHQSACDAAGHWRRGDSGDSGGWGAGRRAGGREDEKHTEVLVSRSVG